MRVTRTDRFLLVTGLALDSLGSKASCDHRQEFSPCPLKNKMHCDVKSINVKMLCENHVMQI